MYTIKNCFLCKSPGRLVKVEYEDRTEYYVECKCRPFTTAKGGQPTPEQAIAHWEDLYRREESSKKHKPLVVVLFILFAMVAIGVTLLEVIG